MEIFGMAEQQQEVVNREAEWVAQAFSVETVGGPRQVPGWVSDVFALDFRIFSDDEGDYSAWHLTHLPTGYSICHFTGNLDEVQSLVEELRGIADWSFTDPATCGAFHAFQAFRDRHPSVRRSLAIFSAASISPAKVNPA